MEKYWKSKQSAAAPGTTDTVSNTRKLSCKARRSKYDEHRQSLVNAEPNVVGWQFELRHYLAVRPSDIDKDTDIVKWWQVSYFVLYLYILY
jgi:hypothetical protein